MFCHKIALPLRDRVPSTVRVDDSVKLVPLNRKRYDHLLFIVFPPTLLAALALGWSRKSWHFVVLPVAVLGFWLLLRFSIPKEGRQDVNLLFSPTGRAQLLIFSVLITFQLLLLCLALVGVEKGIACGIVLGVFLVALIPLLRALHKGVRHQQVTELQGAATANEAWQNGELGSNS